MKVMMTEYTDLGSVVSVVLTAATRYFVMCVFFLLFMNVKQKK